MPIFLLFFCQITRRELTCNCERSYPMFPINELEKHNNTNYPHQFFSSFNVVQPTLATVISVSNSPGANDLYVCITDSLSLTSILYITSIKYSLINLKEIENTRLVLNIAYPARLRKSKITRLAYLSYHFNG